LPLVGTRDERVLAPILQSEAETEPYYSRCCIAAIALPQSSPPAQQQPPGGGRFPRERLAPTPYLGFNLNKIG